MEAATPNFITRRRYTAAAVRSMTEHPQDRARAVAGLLERAAGKLVGFQITFERLWGYLGGRKSTSCSRDSRTTASTSWRSCSWSNRARRRRAGVTQNRARAGTVWLL